jgi:hypothetical protein
MVSNAPWEEGMSICPINHPFVAYFIVSGGRVVIGPGLLELGSGLFNGNDAVLGLGAADQEPGGSSCEKADYGEAIHAEVLVALGCG